MPSLLARDAATSIGFLKIIMKCGRTFSSAKIGRHNLTSLTSVVLFTAHKEEFQSPYLALPEGLHEL